MTLVLLRPDPQPPQRHPCLCANKSHSACFSAGASFTPSPVIPTIWPLDCRSLTILYLSSGYISANPSDSSMILACSVYFKFRMSSILIILLPIPTCAAISLAMAMLSPVSISGLTPSPLIPSIIFLESGRGGSANDTSPTNCRFSKSSTVDLATPSAL